MPTTPSSPPPGEGVPTTEDAFAESSGAEPTEVMPATPPPADAVGAEPGAGGAVPPGEMPDAPGEAGDETPWYKTPLGIAGLILGGLLLVALLILIFWGSGDDDDGDPGAARLVLETVDTSGAALDRGFVANVTGPAEASGSFAWLQPQSVLGPEGVGSTTGDDGVITFEWAPTEDVDRKSVV